MEKQNNKKKPKHKNRERNKAEDIVTRHIFVACKVVI